MSAREAVLGRIRRALVDVADAPPAQVDWEYAKPRPMDDVLEMFVERVVDYRAVMERCPADQVGESIVKALQANGVSSVVLPSGLDAAWRGAIEDAGIQIRDDDPQLSASQLNEIDGVVTAAACGFAETGTIVLDHRPDQGRRALTLVPDVHVCVVRADQVVTDVPEGMARLAEAIRDGQPLTWISGPSATSDIELERVEGVHGPRILHALLVV